MNPVDERKVFVASLNVGDKVAVRSRSLGSSFSFYGYQIFTVRSISPERTKFELLCPDSVVWHFAKNGIKKAGSKWDNHIFYMEKPTPEIEQSIIDDNIRIKADGRRGRIVYKIDEIRNTFPHKSLEFYSEFLDASDSLMKFLDKHSKLDPEDE
jgi:hypothetical protein